VLIALPNVPVFTCDNIGGGNVSAIFILFVDHKASHFVKILISCFTRENSEVYGHGEFGHDETEEAVVYFYI
jgi:hypothetical protein